MNTQVYWIVMVLRHWGGLSVLGVPLSMEPEVVGCIGFLPVFSTRQTAEEWRLQHGHLNAEVVGITENLVVMAEG